MNTRFAVALLAFGQVVLLLLLLAEHSTNHRARIAVASESADHREASTRIATWSSVAQGTGAIAVAVFTLLLVWYSHRGWQVAREAAEAAKKAAEVADKSLRVLNQQWLKLRDWSVTRVDYTGDYGITRDALSVRFSIENPSGMPLTLASVAVSFNPREVPVKSNSATVVPPRESADYVGPTYLLTESHAASYAERRLSFPVFTVIEFVDAFGDAKSQHFVTVLTCGNGMVTKASDIPTLLHDYPIVKQNRQQQA